MGLKEYRSRRKFEKTPEPKPVPHPEGNDLIFVVHKHAARALHYDLRLELEGVLKSWAVPKGPSMDPSVKRLAVKVEDHPFDYRDFEGVIPEGNYGAGSVIIWDRGFYHHPSAGDRKEEKRLLLDGLRKGDLKFVLHGERLHGEFALVKTSMGEKSWLLLKKKDRYAVKGDILTEDRSVVSGRTLQEVSGAGRERPSGHITAERIRIRDVMEGEDLNDAPVNLMPRGIKPMLATLAKGPFDHPDWIFEVKWDGYRAVAEVRGNEVSLYSRNLLPLNRKFPSVARALERCEFDAVLDGEIVVADDQGRSDFQLLQDYRKSGRGHLLYYVFDILHLDGHDLTGLPLLRRKKILQRILPSAPELKFSDHIAGDGVLFFNAVKEKNLEGIVAKGSQSVYLIGRRGRQWLKIKTRLTQEGVIAGFTGPGRNGRYFGSLVLGVFEGDRLVYIGRSGSGFTTGSSMDIRKKMGPLVRKKCPFYELPDISTPVTWLKPELVCEVVFQEWTDEGVMRQPVFLRLREDKDARDTVRESPDTLPVRPVTG